MSDKARETAIKMLTELSDAWRGDWADFDGRTLRYQIQDVISVLNGNSNMTIDEFRSECNLCEGGGGHWREGWMECPKCKVPEAND